MDQVGRTKVWRGVIVIALASLLAMGHGCASRSTKEAVPAALASAAQVRGMDGVRFWGDEAGPELRDWVAQGLQRERARLRAEGVTQLPPTSYLALSGGGPDGAFGAGILCGWTARGDRPAFRVVTGISTGALIAPFAFAGPEYDSVLREVYTKVHTNEILRLRGPVRGLLSDGLSSSEPLRRLIERHVDMAFLERVAAEYNKGRSLIICTTNMDAQRPVIWAMGVIASRGTPEALRLFRQVMLASASIPGVFPPVYIEVEAGGRTWREMHADGGVASQVFLYPASFSFRDVDAEFGSRRQRTAYVIRNGRLAPSYDAVPATTLPIAGRAISTLIKTQGVGDLYRIYLGCVRDDVGFNLAYIPDSFEARPAEMFDPVYMSALFELGKRLGRDGELWKQAPPGFEPPRIGRTGTPAHTARAGDRQPYGAHEP